MTARSEKAAWVAAKEAYNAEYSLWFLKDENPAPFEVKRGDEVMFTSNRWMESYEFLEPARDEACWQAVVDALKTFAAPDGFQASPGIQLDEYRPCDCTGAPCKHDFEREARKRNDRA